MKLKDLRLDVEALFSQAVYGHGFLHYGYWPDGPPDNPSLDKLGRAQQAYFDRMLELIPKDVERILDVGSGTGSNAQALIARGFKVDCVCPSPKLNQMAREKLPEATEIFECGFEDFQSPESYDLLIFCESFHYINAEQAVLQAQKYSAKYVLIFDYFRRQESTKKDRITYRSFLNHVHESQFTIIHDEDVTDFIRPTFLVLDNLKNIFIKPFTEKLVNDYKKEHPVYTFFFKYPINKLTKNLKKPSRRFEKFPLKHEYRLILLQKS